MNPTATAAVASHEHGNPGPQTAAGRVEIDAACRAGVLAFLSSSVFWLIFGSLAALIASYKLHAPDWLGHVPWLTFGRIRVVHLNAVAYGWVSMACLGVLIWLVTRICRTPVRRGALLVLAAALWNIGLAIGLLWILLGRTTGVEWLEMPMGTVLLLAAAVVLVACEVYRLFANRQVEHLYISLWYSLAAITWLPLLYVLANLPIYSGVPHATMNWWFGHNAIGVFWTPVGLAAIYYFIPKVTGRPIYSYYLSMMGFWTFALFYNWNGMHHLVGGPVPTWLITAGITASFLMVIPVLVVALNHHMTIVGSFDAVRYSPTLRFVVFGAINYTAVSLIGSVESSRTLSEVIHFTHFTVGHAHHGLYAFLSMVLFGSMYFIVPRLTSWEWGSAALIKTHFWTTAIGSLLMVAALSVGGWFQGRAWNDPTIPFGDVVTLTRPYLVTRTVAGTLMTIGHFVFAALYIRICLRLGREQSTPTYLGARKGLAA